MSYLNKNEELRQRERYFQTLSYLGDGLIEIVKKPKRMLLAAVYWLLVIFLIQNYSVILKCNLLATKLLEPVFFMLIPVLAIVFFLFLVILGEIPPQAQKVNDAMHKAGVINKVNMSAELVQRQKTMCNNVENTKLVLKTPGIPLTKFEDNLEAIEAALNCRITHIEEGQDRQHIILNTIPGTVKLSENLQWTASKAIESETVIALGESLNGQTCVDLSVTPHILIGGGTGSGKTTLLKSVVAQCLDKNIQVYLIDMKGGLDFPKSWKTTKCSYYDDVQAVLSGLSYLVQELHSRKLTLKDFEAWKNISCPDIDTFNRLRPERKFPHIVLVCDELSELTKISALGKEHKALADTIIQHLSVLARLGRAFGIHLILCTQSPRADAVPGIIKDNLDVRICGRADLVLSEIVLDNGDAAKKIPKTSRGRFVTNLEGGTVFQGYNHLDIQ